MDRHLRARRHALSRHHRQAPAGCALAHGQRRVRAGPRSRAQLLPPRRSWRRSTRRCGSRSASGRNRSRNGASTLLAPEPKRDRGRLSLGRALDRLRTGDPARSPAPRSREREAPSRCRATEPSPVPAPPDAPQPKGQLLDFIEALKKRRAGARRARRRSRRPRQRLAGDQPRAGAALGARQSGSATGRRASRRDAGGAPEASAAAEPAERQAPAAGGARPPRRRLVRAASAGWRMPSRRWRSLLYRLAIGLGIAGLAVAYQDKLPHIEGRGASVVSSQADRPRADHAHHRPPGRGHGRLPPTTRGAGSSRPAPTARCGCGTPAPARSCARSSSTKGRPTAIAVDDRRALTGHKGGAIVLWDLERAEKLATFQHQQAPDLGARIHRRRRTTSPSQARPEP